MQRKSREPHNYNESKKSSENNKSTSKGSRNKNNKCLKRTMEETNLRKITSLAKLTKQRAKETKIKEKTSVKADKGRGHK